MVWHCIAILSDYEWQDVVIGVSIGKTYSNCEVEKQFTSAIAMMEISKVADEIKDVNFISTLSEGSNDSSITEQELFYI